jgi:hypothetical protein
MFNLVVVEIMTVLSAAKRSVLCRYNVAPLLTSMHLGGMRLFQRLHASMRLEHQSALH